MKGPKRVLYVGQVLGCDRGFLCRDSVLFSVMTMSRQRFPYRDQDDHKKRSGLPQSLVKARRFRVST